jgi:pyruvate/2-oxoglutarate dehydrogenase complex dihydrolipoamide dehydrogenase (E3) component
MNKAMLRQIKYNRQMFKGLFAAGDVKGSMGALAAAYDGGIAATSIVYEWYD